MNEKSEQLNINEIQLISFKLDREEFGVAIDNVKEILKLPEITPIPKAPAYLLGMMNLRGSIIPVLDTKKRLNFPTQSVTTAKSRILVLYVSGQLSGVMVDEVSEVQRIQSSAIEPPPQVTGGIDKYFLESVVKLPDKNRLILMLNLNEVLNIEISKTPGTVSDSGEMLDIGDITAVPNVPPYVKGIQNVRDQVLPIIEMRKRKPPSDFMTIR